MGLLKFGAIPIAGVQGKPNSSVTTKKSFLPVKYGPPGKAYAILPVYLDLPT
jgi:hypothetical protein